MISSRAEEYFQTQLDPEGQEVFLRVLRKRDLNPYLYEVLVLLFGVAGIHWFYLRRIWVGIGHFALSVLAATGLVWGLLSGDFLLFTANSFTATVVLGLWLTAWLRVKQDVTAFRESNEVRLMDQIDSLTSSGNHPNPSN
jgi:TM2 domain-containing membrane protein YozV